MTGTRKNEDQPLKHWIAEFVSAYRLKPRLTQVSVEKIWAGIAGRVIAKHTTGLSVRGRVLTVRLDSDALRTELSFAKTKLIRALNKKLGETLIDDIHFF
jgi:predicted nucleic acid-binding Zn ribbon protein